MPVNTPSPQYSARCADWEMIEDCLAGERQVKSKTTKYLPAPNATDKSPENQARYDAYIMRAVWHNVTARTVENLVGQVFAVAPVITVPDGLKAVVENADGDGASLEQVAKAALQNVVAFSRAGVLADMANTAGRDNISIEEAEKEGLRPKIVVYGPGSIINWKTQAVGTLQKYSLVVIREEYGEPVDDFTDKLSVQYRALRLIGGKYIVEIWRETAGVWAAAETITPTKPGSVPFDEIPFMFLGARENSAKVEKPLMLDIANLNLALYRNSADYEEAVYMVGQPTPYAAGLSDEWVDRHLGGQFFIGSRALIPLPDGGTAGLIQASPNTLPKEAMDQKEKQMIALGANVVDQAEVAKTATETSITASVDTAILAAAANNVTAGIWQALKWCADFAGVTYTDDTLAFDLNTDFAIARMPAPDRAQLIAEVAAELVTWKEARQALRASGVAYLDDDEAKEEIEAKQDADLEKAKKEMANATDEQIRLSEETAPEPAAAA